VERTGRQRRAIIEHRAGPPFTKTLGDMTMTTATAVITAAVAVLVAVITLGQWVTNRARLRHELFDRRYSVYENIAGFVAEILISGKVPVGEPEGFSRRTKTAYFVFECDNDVKVLITEIYRHAVNLHALEATLETLTGDERKRNVEAQRVEKEWFQQTLGSLETRFEKYLKLAH
jgi:hypothetical protein